MSRVIAIDYGKARIGIAISDERRTLALPLICLKGHKDLKKNVNEVLLFLAKKQFVEVVIGLPLLMSGKDSDLTQEVRAFATLLGASITQPIKLWDERLTSKQVEKLLIEQGIKRRERTDKVDTMAATIILQSYLDSLPNPGI